MNVDSERQAYLEGVLASLTDDELLWLHKEVSRDAAKVYGERYRTIQQANYRAAMAFRDTRFKKGLSALENAQRSHDLRGARIA